jgi:hypothetical protein
LQRLNQINGWQLKNETIAEQWTPMDEPSFPLILEVKDARETF